MIKVGDRVRVGTWDMHIEVSKIYFENDNGEEVFEFEATRKMLALKWGKNGELGKSKVALHDEGKVWHKVMDLN